MEEDTPCVLEDDVTVGHMAMVHAAHVEVGSLVGISSSLLSRCTIGAGSLIAAGAVVLEGTKIPPRSLAAGVPTKVRRELSPEESEAFIPHAARYVECAQRQSNEPLSLDEVLFD